MTAIGVDIGGTKTLAALVDADGTVLSRAEAPTPSRSGAEAIICVATDLIASLEAGNGVPIGLGAAGTIDPRTGVVRFATDSLTGWAGTALADEIGRRTGRVTVAENDVNAAALAEAWRGSGRGHDHVLLVAAGTGLGGGLVGNGRIYRGARGAAMEMAHLVVGHTDDACGCGRRGHLEAVASGTAIARAYARRTGEQVPAREVARRAEAGEDSARKVLELAGDVLGRALAGCVALLDVDVVVLAGGVAPALLGHATKAYRTELLPAYAGVELVPATLVRDAVVVGAARLAMKGDDEHS